MMDDENAFWDDQVQLLFTEKSICKAIYDDSNFSSNTFVRYLVYNNTEVNPDFKTFSSEKFVRMVEAHENYVLDHHVLCRYRYEDS